MKKCKSLIALALAGVMTVSLAACGGSSADATTDNGSTGSQTTSEKEYIYVAEELDLGIATGTYLSSYTFAGDSFTYAIQTWDEEMQSSLYTLYSYSLTDNQTYQLPIQTAAGADLNGLEVDADGNVYLVESAYDEEYVNQTFSLEKYTSAGELVWAADLTEALSEDADNSWISAFAIDGEGRSYLMLSDRVLLVDSEGTVAGLVGSNDISSVQSIGRATDGKVYLCYYNVNYDECFTGIDFAGKSTTGNLGSATNNSSKFAPGIAADICLYDGYAVYDYDVETEESTEILSWLDSDVDSTYVNYVAPYGEDVLVLIYDYATNETSLARLVKTKADEAPQKTELTLGTIYFSQTLQAAVVDFNKSSDTYHISLKTYIDNNADWSDTTYTDAIAAFNNDLATGKGADLIDLSSLQIEPLVNKGILEDLTPYLESSQVLSKDDIFESVLNAYTYDGKLVTIPQTIYLSTVVGRSSEVGSTPGWTLDDIIAYKNEHPEAKLFNFLNKSYMLQLLLSYNTNSFIDWESATCNFDSDDFVKLLEFVNTLPAEADDSGDVSTATKIRNGEVLLYTDTIADLNTIQETAGIFGEPITYIGYPSKDGSVSGTYINCNNAIGINANSAHKDAAWTFLETYVNTLDPDSWMTWGLSPVKSKFEEYVNDLLTDIYMTDENGETILDSDGNPISKYAGSSVSYGDDYTYTYHNPTEEEAETLRSLLENAAPASDALSETLLSIILEEAEPFFQGQKSASDVAGIIQNRLQIYLKENS